jgi:hypothetical protein
MGAAVLEDRVKENGKKIYLKTSKVKPRVGIASAEGAIENLSSIYLGGLAIQEGYEPIYFLIDNHNYHPMIDEVKNSNIQIVGNNIWTGSHEQAYTAFDQLKMEVPRVRTILGGPHASYFPNDAAMHADNVVMSEGFNAFRRILRDDVGKGIIQFLEENKEDFPMGDRIGFYAASPRHRKSKVKSITGSTGCTYRCDYCYNSTDAIMIAIEQSLLAGNKFHFDRLRDWQGLFNGKFSQSNLEDVIRENPRLFANNVRNPEAIVDEIELLASNFEEDTEVLYWQDDIIMADTEWGKKIRDELDRRGLAQVFKHHGQLRPEMAVNEGGKERLDTLKELNFSGLTMAIEAEEPVIRSELLSRGMSNETLYEACQNIADRDLRQRTEQITFLPYGFTSKPTKMNLDADLGLVELNVDLREKTGRPTMAWYSTLVYYPLTNIGTLGDETGAHPNDLQIEDTFFKRGHGRALKEWPGPDFGLARINKLKLEKSIQNLERKRIPVPQNLRDQFKVASDKYYGIANEIKNNPDYWLSDTDLERYRDQNAELRNHGTVFSRIPKGHIIARSYLESPEEFSYDRLGKEIGDHLREQANLGNIEAQEMITRAEQIRASGFGLSGDPEDKKLLQDLHKLSNYIAVLPESFKLAEKSIEYARQKDGNLTTERISTAARHHLYDILYGTMPQDGNEPSVTTRAHENERYAPKYHG